MVVWHHESKGKVAAQYTALIAAIVLVSQSGVTQNSWKQVAMSAYQNLADVSAISAAVPSNEFNSLAQQFKQRDQELSAREQALIAHEADLDQRYQEMIAANKHLTLYVLGGVTFLLLLLIFLNFYFDILREEEREKGDSRVSSGGSSSKI